MDNVNLKKISHREALERFDFLSDDVKVFIKYNDEYIEVEYLNNSILKLKKPIELYEDGLKELAYDEQYFLIIELHKFDLYGNVLKE